MLLTRENLLLITNENRRTISLGRTTSKKWNSFIFITEFFFVLNFLFSVVFWIKRTRMLESLRWVRSRMTVFTIAIWTIISFNLLFVIPLITWIIAILRIIFMISLILRFWIFISIRNRSFMITLLETLLLMVILILISILSRWMHAGIIIRIVSSSSHISIFIIVILIVIVWVVITIPCWIPAICGIISFIVKLSLFRVLSVISLCLKPWFGIFNRYFIFLLISLVGCSALWRWKVFFFFWFSRSRPRVVRGAKFFELIWFVLILKGYSLLNRVVFLFFSWICRFFTRLGRFVVFRSWFSLCYFFFVTRITSLVMLLWFIWPFTETFIISRCTSVIFLFLSVSFMFLRPLLTATTTTATTATLPVGAAFTTTGTTSSFIFNSTFIFLFSFFSEFIF